MRAAYLVDDGRRESLVLGEQPMPSPGAGEVLVRVRAAAMNRVDLYMRDDASGITHELPLIAGVDGAGEVVEGEAGGGSKPGDRVMVFPPIGCGACEFCRAGDQTLCRTFESPVSIAMAATPSLLPCLRATCCRSLVAN